MKEGAKELNRSKKRIHLREIAILALVSSFFLTLYAPLEILFTNKEDFWFGFRTIIGFNLLGFVLLSLLLFGILLLSNLIHENVYRFLFLAGTVFYLGFYIEGTFFAGSLPMQDGRKVIWSDYASHRFFSIAIYAVLITAVIILVWKLGFEKLQKAVIYLLVGMSAMFLITVITLGIKNKGFEDKTRIKVSKENEFTFSTDKNFFIFLIDATDGSTFEEVMTKHPEYEEWFSDFTYYSNMVSTYSHTSYAVPYILSGYWFHWGDDYDEFKNAAYSSSPFLDRLKKDGYRIGLYCDLEPVPPDENVFSTFENIETAPMYTPDPLVYAKVFAKLVGYRYAPFDLKRFCEVYVAEDFRIAKSFDWSDEYTTNNIDFLNDLNNAEFQLDESKPCFKWIHVEGSHVPYRYDANVNLIENGTYSQNVEASMTLAHDMIEKMKENGVYDNTAFLIMADHGFNPEDIPEGRMHPVFFAKGIGETADTMRRNDAPVSHEDLMVAFDRLLDGADSSMLFDWKEGDERERELYVFSYPVKWRVLKYKQKGHASDMTTMECLED